MPAGDQETLPPTEDEIIGRSEAAENQVVIEDDNVKEFVGELEARIEALETTASHFELNFKDPLHRHHACLAESESEFSVTKADQFHAEKRESRNWDGCKHDKEEHR